MTSYFGNILILTMGVFCGDSYISYIRPGYRSKKSPAFLDIYYVYMPQFVHTQVKPKKKTAALQIRALSLGAGQKGDVLTSVEPLSHCGDCTCTCVCVCV